MQFDLNNLPWPLLFVTDCSELAGFLCMRRNVGENRVGQLCFFREK